MMNVITDACHVIMMNVIDDVAMVMVNVLEVAIIMINVIGVAKIMMNVTMIIAVIRIIAITFGKVIPKIVQIQSIVVLRSKTLGRQAKGGYVSKMQFN